MAHEISWHFCWPCYQLRWFCTRSNTTDAHPHSKTGTAHSEPFFTAQGASKRVFRTWAVDCLIGSPRKMSRWKKALRSSSAISSLRTRAMQANTWGFHCEGKWCCKKLNSVNVNWSLILIINHHCHAHPPQPSVQRWFFTVHHSSTINSFSMNSCRAKVTTGQSRVAIRLVGLQIQLLRFEKLGPGEVGWDTKPSSNLGITSNS